MLNKVYNKFFQKNEKVNMPSLLAQLNQIRASSDRLVLYGSPTEGNWLGIANATKELYPQESVEIPQRYSNPILSPAQTQQVCKEIIRLNFKKVIISGFANHFFHWIDLLYKSVTIEIIFHGTISEFHEPQKRELVTKMVKAATENKINRFGFVKHGLAEVFLIIYGIDSYHQPLKTPSLPTEINKLKLDETKFHIGVFGADTFNKNLHNQVIHALIIPNTVIHVLDKSIFSYLQKDDRIIEHGKNLDRKSFLTILASMNLNLYMSYNESWGLVAYESEALGIPCLQTDNIDYLEKIKRAIEKHG